MGYSRELWRIKLRESEEEIEEVANGVWASGPSIGHHYPSIRQRDITVNHVKAAILGLVLLIVVVVAIFAFMYVVFLFILSGVLWALFGKRSD